MKLFNKAVIIGLIGVVSLASSVSADRATLADNDWNGMTRTSLHSGSLSFGGDDLDNPAWFRNPAGVLALPNGSVIVADTVNQVIKKVADGGTSLYSGVSLTTDAKGLPEGALLDGTRDASAFHAPIGLDHDADGNVYVADSGNHAIRKIAPDGSVTTIAGDGVIGLTDGNGEQARFYYPSDVAVAADGTIYVADTLNHVIRKIDTNGNVTTLNAASERIVEIIPGIIEEAGDYRDGRLSRALFNEPSGLALDSKGNLYVSDSGNQRIRYIDFAIGIVTTVAGGAVADADTGELYEDGALYVEGFYRDGAAADALFFSPKGIALTEDEGLLIADSENHVIRYLKDGQVTTIAGVPEQYGFANGIEHHSLLYRPSDVAVAADGKILIADTYNNVIRQVELYELPHDYKVSSDIQVVYEDQVIAFDTQPEALNGRTMVPVRLIAEALGYEVSYAQDAQKVTLANDERTIDFYLGRSGLTVRDSEGTTRDQQIDVAPYAKNNRTYVPVRFFAEVIDMDVSWIQDEQVVVIRAKTTD